MDDRRFDALARALAAANNRRQVLKGLLGIGGVAAAMPYAGIEAARRPTPAPKPVSCPGEQTWNGTACLCPAGKVTCGAECCAPGVSECCDNACCFGSCYGEELCCPTGTIHCDGECRDWECCSDSDCPETSVCNVESHACTCAPDCTGKECGDDGCGETCGGCPDGQICHDGACACTSGVRCSDNACHDCCAAADCSAMLGGDAECWQCLQGICGYYSGFCAGGVCGVSSSEAIGHCIACGVTGDLSSDACSAAAPCCSGYTCDFQFGDQGLCQPASGGSSG